MVSGLEKATVDIIGGRNKIQSENWKHKRESYDSVNFGNLMMRFYMFELINAFILHVDEGKKNGLEVTDSINIQLLRLKEQRRQIVSTVKKILKEYLFKAVVGELFHNEGTPIVKGFIASFFNSDKRRRMILGKRIREGLWNYADLNRDRDSKYRNFLFNNMSDSEIIAFLSDCEDMFLTLRFPDDKFGGPKWSKIADLAEMLWSSHDMDKDVILIDRIIDLEHNTGSVLDKDPKLRIDWALGQPYYIRSFLDEKAKINTLNDFLDYYRECCLFARNPIYDEGGSAFQVYPRNLTFTDQQVEFIDTLNEIILSVRSLSKLHGSPQWNSEIRPILNGILG